MNAAVECEGAPRDLGRDQGLACGASLRERFAAEPLSLRLRLGLGRAGGPATRLRRQLLRHLPRQAETLAGIAAAARVPEAWLVLRLERERREPGSALAAAASAELTGASAIVGRAPGGEWVVRRSCPEGGFRCVELTRPWLAHALLGVNDAGIAVAVSAAGDTGGDGVLPAAPLATDCLQRFATLGACLEWCAARPGDGPATLLFADAHGEIAGIEIGPGRRRVLRSAEGWLAAGGSRDERDRLAKRLRESGRLGPALASADPAARALHVGTERYDLSAASAR